MKDPRIEQPKPKAQDPKPINSSFDITGTSKKAWKKSKKWFWKEKYKQTNFNSGTPATESNTSSNKVRPKNAKKDLFGIMCYNCKKKENYYKTCPKSKKIMLQKLVVVSATSALVI